MQLGEEALVLESEHVGEFDGGPGEDLGPLDKAAVDEVEMVVALELS